MMTSCQQNCDVIVIFPIYGQIGATGNPDYGRIVCKTYIFDNSNLLSYKNWKKPWKISRTGLTLLLWVKVLFLPNNADFLQKMLISAKLNRPWY